MAQGEGGGRPSIRTDDLVDELMSRIEAGESLTRICEDAHMPSRSTALAWIRNYEEVSARYARARAIGATAIVDSMDAIEDRVLRGDLDQASARTVLWSRQWRASKADPILYGDRKIVQGDKEADPVRHEHKMIDFSEFDSEQLALVKALLGTADK